MLFVFELRTERKGFFGASCEIGFEMLNTAGKCDLGRETGRGVIEGEMEGWIRVGGVSLWEVLRRTLMGTDKGSLIR